jgi:hypothetical protein
MISCTTALAFIIQSIMASKANGKRLTIQFFASDGEKKMEKNSGSSKIVGGLNGEKVATLGIK